MNLKTMQWNIGGGKLLDAGADPTLLKSYTADGIDEIIEVIRAQAPDIITLQETHADQNGSQAEKIAKSLGYEYWYNDEYADSHIEDGQRLGQAIISRWPLTDHSFQLFENPNFEAVWEDGSIAHSHDKGRTRAVVELADKRTVVIQTFHTVPFRRFNIDIQSGEAKAVLADMSAKLAVAGQGLIQADFNLDADNLADLFPSLFEAGFREPKQPQPTTIRGHTYDHILANDMTLLDCNLLRDVRTDHFPLVATFEV